MLPPLHNAYREPTRSAVTSARRSNGSRIGWRRLALGQGIYYAATGAWSIVSIGTFQKVTGPKTDRWLVKTVGGLVIAVGGALALASREERPHDSTIALAATSAAALAVVDFWYPLRGRISAIYVLDGVIEAALVAAWIREAQFRRENYP